MKTIHLSAALVLALLTAGAAGCGSGSAVDGYVSSGEISGTISDSIVGADAESTAAEPDGIDVPQDSEPYIIEKPVVADDSVPGLNSENAGVVGGAVSETPPADSASETPSTDAPESPDAGLQPAPAADQPIKPSNNGIVTVYRPQPEYTAITQLGATAEPYHEPEEYQAAPYLSAEANYEQHTEPQRPVLGVPCLLAGCLKI